MRCHEGTAETCNDLGDWAGISCRSDEICSLSDDTVDCIDNSPYAYGFAELFDGAFAQPPDGMMMLVRLPEFQTRANVNEAELLTLGLLAEGDPGVYARIALYTEMDGLPYQYRLSSRDEISVTDNPEGCAAITRPCSSVGNSNSFMLNDGDRYWLGVVFSSHPSNLLVRQRAGSSLGSKIVMIPHQYSAQFPVTLSPDDLVTYAAVEWNLFITVKDKSP